MDASQLRQLFLAVLLLGLVGNVSLAQQETGGESTSIRTVEPITTLWEMGVEVTVEGGAATGIVATCPLPVDWPEQSIKVLEEQFSDEVSRVAYKDLDGAVRQMVLTIPRLADGQTARAVVRIEVTKSWIEAPTDTATLQFPSASPMMCVRSYSPVRTSKARIGASEHSPTS